MTSPVRKAITRGKQTFRVKFPSSKNKRMVLCESMLEADTALYLEISPYVKTYRAQPCLVLYYDEDGTPRRYVPDFRAVLHDGSVIDIEVKPESRLFDPNVKSKLKAICLRYFERGRNFRIFTERHVRAEPLYSNLREIAYHSRTPIGARKMKVLKDRLEGRDFQTISDAAAIIGGEHHAYRLIASGFLGIDFHQKLGPGSKVWIREMEGDHDSLRV